MYNIRTNDNKLMLLCDVPTLGMANYWLMYYSNKYAPGKPYPSGEGAYPNSGFHIVERTHLGVRPI